MNLKKLQLVVVILLAVLTLLAVASFARTIVFTGTGTLKITVSGNTTNIKCDGTSSKECQAVVEIIESK